DDRKIFDGFTDGTKWNGFDNIWVTPDTHAQVIEHMGDDPETLEMFRELEPMEHPEVGTLYSYSHGFTTSIYDELSEPHVKHTRRIVHLAGALTAFVGLMSDERIRVGLCDHTATSDHESFHRLYRDCPGLTERDLIKRIAELL